MYRKIRITVVSLMIVAVCVLSSSATLSYFTDTDGVTNNFTVGDVSTVLAIYDDAAGTNLLNASLYSPLDEDKDIPFYLQATNNGNVAVYQRFRVVVPIALADVVTLKSAENSCKIADACNNANYTVTYNSNVDDTYAEYYIVSSGVLETGQKTIEWPVTEISINGINGVSDQLPGCSTSSSNCVLGVKVYSDAIQATGLDEENVFGNFAETYN